MAVFVADDRVLVDRFDARGGIARVFIACGGSCLLESVFWSAHVGHFIVRTSFIVYDFGLTDNRT